MFGLLTSAVSTEGPFLTRLPCWRTEPTNQHDPRMMSITPVKHLFCAATGVLVIDGWVHECFEGFINSSAVEVNVILQAEFGVILID